MSKVISIRGLATTLMVALVWYFFTISGTEGELVKVNTTLEFIGEKSMRSSGTYYYYVTEGGVKLEARTIRGNYERLESLKYISDVRCDVIYFRNESLVFNEYQTVKTIECGNKEYYLK